MEDRASAGCAGGSSLGAPHGMLLAGQVWAVWGTEETGQVEEGGSWLTCRVGAARQGFRRGERGEVKSVRAWGWL